MDSNKRSEFCGVLPYTSTCPHPLSWFNWRHLIAGIAFNLKQDAANGIFLDKHVYKVLKCTANGVVEDELTHLAVRKVAEQQLISWRRLAHE